MNNSDLEIEVKFYIQDIRSIEQRLHSLGALMIQPRHLEKNIRFDTPDGLFQRTGRVLRLRRDTAIHLTYKDQSQAQDGVVSRREIEFDVSDYQAARKLIQALGYQAVFQYEKYRTTYKLGKVFLMLDSTPIGDFVEIEGQSEELKAAADKLILNWEDAIPASYHDLFKRVCISRNFNFADLSFSSFAGFTVSPSEFNARAADIEKG